MVILYIYAVPLSIILIILLINFIKRKNKQKETKLEPKILLLREIQELENLLNSHTEISDMSYKLLLEINTKYKEYVNEIKN